MRNIILLEILSIYRALHVTVPLIIVPSIILCLSIFTKLDQRIFIFSSVYSMQLLILMLPLLLSEIVKGGWRVMYQADVLYEPIKVIPVIIFSSLLLTLPTVAIFIILYTILLHNLFSFGILISLIGICLFSYSFGSFLKTFINDQTSAIIICILYEALLLPFAIQICLYSEQNPLSIMWPILMSMNTVVNPIMEHLMFEQIVFSVIECFFTYFLLVVTTSWLLNKRIKL